MRFNKNQTHDYLYIILNVMEKYTTVLFAISKINAQIINKQ
jgi:hypothetical protein